MLEYILDGGLLMYPLVACSVVALAVILDRLRAFRAVEADTVGLRSKITGCLDNGQIDEAVSVCRQYHGPVAAVLLAGLDRYRKLKARGRAVVEIETNVKETMEDYAPHAMEPLEMRLNLLSMIGSIAPLLGMTGTVTGMIASFNTMAEMGGLDAGGVAGGIAEALTTTGAGLLIAVPAVVAYNVFSRKTDRYVLEIEQTMRDLLDFIALGDSEPPQPS
ncbi:MAG TPA: MotA/TolQ/ExbB proton channel family protein [Planctomycetota bacterium]|nr:MotA/TolQ/ExbB proton channel family protein [Planctomycetota bacterium]